MTDDLFKNDSEDQNTDLFKGGGDSNGTQVDPTKNYLEELVGEGKKFASVNDLARGKYEADLYIERMIKEFDELQDELSKRMTMEEVLDRMNQKNAAADHGNKPPVHQGDDESNHPSLDPEELKKSIFSELQAKEAKERAASNVSQVKERLIKEFGPNFASHLKQLGSDIGMSTEALNNLASENPKALYRLIGLDGSGKKQESAPTSPASNQYRPDTNSRGGDTRDQKYWQKVKQENPSFYHSAKARTQRHKDAQALGEAFFN